MPGIGAGQRRPPPRPRRDPLVSEHPVYWSLGNTPFERELAHANLLEVGLSPIREQVLQLALKRGQAVGSVAFLAQSTEAAGRPLVTRGRGPPKKDCPLIRLALVRRLYICTLTPI